MGAGHPATARAVVTTPTTERPFHVVTDRTPRGAPAVTTTTAQARERWVQLVAELFRVWIARECQPGTLAMLGPLTDRQLVAVVLHDVVGLSYQRITDLVGTNQKRGQKQHSDLAAAKLAASPWHTEGEAQRRIAAVRHRRIAASVAHLEPPSAGWLAAMRRAAELEAIDRLMREPPVGDTNAISKALGADAASSGRLHHVTDIRTGRLFRLRLSKGRP